MLLILINSTNLKKIISKRNNAFTKNHILPKVHFVVVAEKSDLPPPPSPQWCANQATRITTHLMRDHKEKKWLVQYLLRMLNEGYIVSLPRLKRDTNHISDRSPWKLRWLWQTWARKLLEWREGWPEEHPKGFSPATLLKSSHS
jgi:hypothetical protein